MERKEKAKMFYNNNKELCKLRISLFRCNNEKEKEEIKAKLNQMNSIITEVEISFIKSINLRPIMKNNPKLRMWDKDIKKWTFKDFHKLKNLL